MIKAASFIRSLEDRGIDFFTGVPDSRLASFCAAIQESVPSSRHVVAANEGNAVGLAIGHYLATARPALVYMQNSGLGNAINPITSLADKEIYSIPMLLVIGWRGAPGENDEPQHVKQGLISADLLDLLGIPYDVMTKGVNSDVMLDSLCGIMREISSPVALLVKEGAILPDAKRVTGTGNASCFTREQAIASILDVLEADDCLLATTGKAGRELFELRGLRHESQQDFLCVGGMGHCSSIALGAALARPDKRFICLDGDGALLMHMGAMGAIAGSRPGNFVHVLLNNRCHESVGGQPTCSPSLDFVAVAKACGYMVCLSADGPESIRTAFTVMRDKAGPHFLEISVSGGARSNLGRPDTSPLQNKLQFAAHLSSSGR